MGWPLVRRLVLKICFEREVEGIKVEYSKHNFVVEEPIDSLCVLIFVIK